MPRTYKCSLNCSKKNAKGWCIDTMAKISEDENGNTVCDSQKIPIEREQTTLF